MKRGTRAVLCIVLVLAASVGVLFAGFLLPYYRARSAMPEGGALVIEQQEDGTLALTWPASDTADCYCLEILVPADAEKPEPQSVYRTIVSGTGCVLPELPDGMELTLAVHSVGIYRTLGTERMRICENPMSVTTTFDAPAVRDQNWTIDSDSKTATVDFVLGEKDRCSCYVIGADGEKNLLRELSDPPMVLRFGEGGDLPLPEAEEAVHLAFRAYRSEPGLKFYGNFSAQAMVEREHLLSRSLELNWTARGDNTFALFWDEAKGEHYEVQLLAEDTGDWTTLAQIPGGGERSYITPHLPGGRALRCRVVTVGGHTLPGSDMAAVSEEVVLKTAPSARYATVWPMTNLTGYRDANWSERAGAVSAGTACCVLGEKNGMFLVRVDGTEMYIDSTYCLINLPEYMGSLCSYNITNSYDSKYMIHEFMIPEVTGVVTGGYENVQLFNGDYLVPLLYPVAKRLVQAAESALELGYRLKIYDSFRPQRASEEIYTRTAAIINQPLPETPYTNVDMDSLNLPAPQIPEDGSSEAPIRTYKQVMTLRTYELGSFLAPGFSLHNLGIALDLTMEDLYTGEEVPMQSSIHDLSAYSVTPCNNENAKRLAEIMTDAGFGTLFSEWWHFQDNDARSNLGLTALYAGVSSECWMADDRGWRYRTEDGTYYTGQTVKIGEETVAFDEFGYVLN